MAVFIVGALSVISLLNESTSQMVYLIGVLLCGALLLKNGLEMAGGLELMIGAGAVFGPACSKILAEPEAVARLSKIINAVLRFGSGKLGIARAAEVGPESTVTLAFFIIFAALAALRVPRTAVEAQRGPADPEFKEKNYVEKSRDFCKSLAHRLQVIKRENLVVLCRNPFYLALLSNYLKSNDMRFPKNQMELYSNFVEHRLDKCGGKLEAEHLTKEEVREAAKELAVFMQDATVHGLECPLRALSGYGRTKDWRKVLRHAGRAGSVLRGRGGGAGPGDRAFLLGHGPKKHSQDQERLERRQRRADWPPALHGGGVPQPEERDRGLPGPA